jgi:muramoyltetrapeptide carboxypeptidase
LGFGVREGKNLYKNTHGFAASEEERAADFMDMILDDEVKMILFGGGYVGNEILPYLDYRQIAAHPKIISGYSDGATVLGAVYALTGLVTYYGQYPSMFSSIQENEYDKRAFFAAFVEGGAAALEKGGPWKTIRGGSCEGTLIGGYTNNLAMLLDGKYFPLDSSKKYVLFLENHDSLNNPARISSHLAHIEQSGLIKNVVGALFGYYSDREFPDLTAALRRFAARNAIPLAVCDDFSHGRRHAVLPIGAAARLDADRQTLTF